MINKSFGWPLMIRLILFALLCSTITYSVVRKEYVLSVVTTMLMVISAGELIYYFNSVNRKIAFFIDAIRNEDSSLHFSEKINSHAVRKLHKSLNQLNLIISEIKIRNEHNERFYRQLLKYSATGILAVDEKGYVDLVNDAAIRLMGLKHIAHIHLLKQKNVYLYSHITGLKPGQSTVIKLPEGEEIRQLSIKSTRLQFSGKWYDVYTFYDIKAELDENELETWQKLIRIMTHEIMNSIAPITSLSGTLGRIINPELKEAKRHISPTDIEKTIEGLTVIEETGKGLMHFIENYRKLTKIPRPVFVPINIKEWLGRVELLIKEKLDGEGIIFETNIKSTHNELIGDEKLLTRVLINLINNAIDALNRKEKKLIRLNVANDKRGKLQFSITDNGQGIHPDELDKIFIPFFTTKENGSGIGLSLSRQIMRLHKGTISANSVRGEYTTFKLTF
jgi:two-component system nitrogen regulation sensor histidine kinase NtrY